MNAEFRRTEILRSLKKAGKPASAAKIEEEALRRPGFLVQN